ncbi:MAG: hypothetical protein COV67_11415 [Nitrospinae bacterium CG11_big_fil_rev_8_21_14_0_20_56_8]|nr:MAG: hypothetical protein COV67_11415 [Nitrospinae bacterium CG11_big_fil_rev_8_21_14_0_20_56_8]
MATLDQLKKHIEKAKSEAKSTLKSVDDPKKSPEARVKRKKVKRLQRKSAKIVAFQKNQEEKKKPKKERKSGASS